MIELQKTGGSTALNRIFAAERNIAIEGPAVVDAVRFIIKIMIIKGEFTQSLLRFVTTLSYPPLNIGTDSAVGDL